MNKELILLIAEDDTASFILTKRLLKHWNVNLPLIRFTNGRTLLDFLNTATVTNKLATVQYLLLLDINMPDVDGFGVLTRIKNCPRLRHIPVMMLTAIADPFITRRCFDLGCDAFFTKPLKYDELTSTLKKLRIPLPRP